GAGQGACDSRLDGSGRALRPEGERPRLSPAVGEGLRLDRRRAQHEADSRGGGDRADALLRSEAGVRDPRDQSRGSVSRRLAAHWTVSSEMPRSGSTMFFSMSSTSSCDCAAAALRIRSFEYCGASRWMKSTI